MLELSRIPDDRLWGVICNTEQELKDFVEAVKSQRSDIDIGSFGNQSTLAMERYHGKAYFLNYLGSRHLQQGTPVGLPRDLSTMSFEELLIAPELPDIDTDQIEALSMLGL
jgi:hypothetical protein